MAGHGGPGPGPGRGPASLSMGGSMMFAGGPLSSASRNTRSTMGRWARDVWVSVWVRGVGVSGVWGAKLGVQEHAQHHGQVGRVCCGVCMFRQCND